MPATIISTQNIFRGSSGDISLTIPSDCEAVYCFLGCNYSPDTTGQSFSATLAGAPSDDSIVSTSATNYTEGGCVAFYNPPTGSQTLSVTFTSSLSIGAVGLALYVKGQSEGGWRDAGTDHKTSTTNCSVTIDSSSTDIVIALHSRITSYPGVPTNWTQVGSNSGYNSAYSILQQADSPGASTTVCPTTTSNYSNITAISIPEALTGTVAPEIGLNGTVEGYNENASQNEGAGFSDDIDAESDYVFNNFKVGLNASADTSENILQSSASGGFGTHASSDSYKATDQIAKTIGLSATSNAAYQTKWTEDEFGMNCGVTCNREYNRIVEAQVGFNAGVDAYNFTTWAAANLASARKIFELTITGAPDGVADTTIPFSSFQSRKRSDSQSYVAVVIKKYDYASQITARQNGEIVIDAVYLVGGVESLRQEIIRAPIDTITIDHGPRSRSITLSGYKTVTYNQKSVTLQNAVYKRLSAGKLQYRFADVDLFLNPTDELTVGDDTFTVGNISYYVSENQRQMDVFQVEQ